MAKTRLPLEEVSIEDLFFGSERSVYEIPIYQRNYAWEKEEICTLVQDIYDAYDKDPETPYYIGTLVTFDKGDRVFEVIDGQQRLTTLRLLLAVLGYTPTNKLTYKARKKSDDTLKHMPEFNIEEKDNGIENGYNNAKAAKEDLISGNDMELFKTFFMQKVHIIHYQVPKDIDLNHYFEIMNSRGEQLEKHEIVKAKLLQKLGDDKDASRVFNCIWNCCSEMNVYIQQEIEGISAEDVFGDTLDRFLPEDFAGLLEIYNRSHEDDDTSQPVSIGDIISSGDAGTSSWIKEDPKVKDTFLPIIDFPNFLLIVLKITRMSEPEFSPVEFQLDDKELLIEFDNAKMDAEKVKVFVFNLLKARFYLDNYIVHHSREEDTMYNNPWKLQVWYRDRGKEKSHAYARNLAENTSQENIQDKLTHLLSMFEVSFTARQRKNYLFYCLFYLLKTEEKDISVYAKFVEGLADRYFNQVYMDGRKLNSINTPLPGKFDEVILSGYTIRETSFTTKDRSVFAEIYGNGERKTKGIPLFVFNYLDFKLWKLYDTIARNEDEGSQKRGDFFRKLGCSDFGLALFNQFYFSRTRRSLEHYYPQAKATGLDGALNENQINCFGNFAMIGSDANSSGSNWDPKTKLDHYLEDSSGKINQISVASLKFMIMMQICKDNEKWEFEHIKDHQEKMVAILLDNQ